MRLLDRYLLRELLIPLSYCLGGFLIFYCSFDFISHLSRFQQRQLGSLDILQLYLVTTPEILVLIMPVGLLLALLYCLTNHSRHHELTAIRAAGISLWRLSLPYLAVGAIFSTAVLLINEFWVPQSQDKADAILNQRVASKQSGKKGWFDDLKFRNERENRSWIVKSFNPATGQMVQPYIIWELPDGSRREISAQSGVFDGKLWTLSQVTEWVKFPGNSLPESRNYPELKTEFSESPELIRSEMKINSLKINKAIKRPQLSIIEIGNYLRLHPRLNPSQKAVLMTQLQGRIAEPFKCLVVVLIAIPFGSRSGRRNVAVGVAGSIFICFSFYILQSFSLAVGTRGGLPPVVAAWLPNALFGAIGIFLTTRVR